MKQEEIREFLMAYRDGRARGLVQDMMTLHYTEAVMMHHPDPSLLGEDWIKERTTHLCSFIFNKLDGITEQPDKLPELLLRLSRGTIPQDSLWFKEFNEAYENYKHQRKLQIKMKQLSPFMAGGAYADIGCGGGDLAAYLKTHYPGFTSCTGIDVMDWRTESVKDAILFRVFDYSRPQGPAPGPFDFATCMAVLHHVGKDDMSRIRFLQNVRRSMHPSGRLLVEEDVILPAEEIAAIDTYREQAEMLSREQPLFAEYLSLSPGTQKHVLILIDLLANALTVGVPAMEVPFGFKSIEGWARLFYESGLKVEFTRINGFVEGTFNRSSHVVYLLSRD